MPSLRNSLPQLSAVFGAALVTKLVFWWLDPVLALHSDSGLYLKDSFSLQPSWPRPIGYGIFLRVLTELLGEVRIGAVSLAQTLIGAALATGTFAISRRYLRAPLWAAALGAALVTLSPGNLLLERYLLSDALALAVLGLCVALLLAYLQRPGLLRGALLGLAAVLPLVLRASWSLLPLVFLAMALFAFYRPTESPTADPFERRDLRRRALIGLIAALAVGFLSTVAYSGVFSRTTLGEVDLAAGTSGFAGWTLWASVGRFAEPGDLDGIPGGEILLSDRESLQRNGSYQIWDFDSTAHRLRKEFHDGSMVKTNQTLERAAVRVALRHPLSFTGQFLTALKRFFLPTQGNNDYSSALTVDDSVDKFFMQLIGLDIETLDRTPGLTGVLYRPWRYSRWFFSSLLLAGFGWAVLRPRRRLAVLAVATVGVSYLLVVNLAVGFVFVERYYLPVEYLATLVLVGLLAAPGSRRRGELAQMVDRRR
ncbi:MAG: hypothetical protein AAF481_03110 [Acidobacteriota bacterium]